jgi:hypothetical protein
LKKFIVFLALASLSGCSWFHLHAKGPPPSPQLVVTGAPADSMIFVDNVQNGEPAQKGKPQVLTVSAGAHLIEVRTGSTVIYREQTYVSSGESRSIKVLSGSSRE